MYKKIFKMFGLFSLLLLSFIYTEKAFNISRNNDPIMKNIIDYKEKNDYSPVNAIINKDEIILGLSGLIIHKNDSYKNMKESDLFSEDKIISYVSKPTISIENNYDYFITSANKIRKNIYIILKVNNIKDIDYINTLNNNIALFVKDDILKKYYIDSNLEIYNLIKRIDNKNINEVNKIIKENYNHSLYCLNEKKDKKLKNLCYKNKMYSIKPTLINPSVDILKENLENGIIISFDLTNNSINKLKLLITLTESKGYKIDKLSNLIKE